MENPYANQGYVEDLSEIVNTAKEVGQMFGEESTRLLGDPVESYGKAGLVGTAGEQEHINAALTSVFGNAFRDAIGGGDAWITSVTKPSTAGTVIDVPTAYKTKCGFEAITMPWKCVYPMRLIQTRLWLLQLSLIGAA